MNESPQAGKLHCGIARFHDALQDYAARLRFARAAELARSRRYLEAEALLSGNGSIIASANEIDLLARIAAQQRDFKRAIRLWESALELAPRDLQYEQGIARARSAQRSWEAMKKALVIVTSILLGAGLAVFGWGAIAKRSPRAPEAPLNGAQARTKNERLRK